MTVAEQVAQMTPEQALAMRDRLDKTPARDLPGADEIGPMRALRAYFAMRPLLTARVNS